MSGFPTRPSRSAFGPDPVNRTPVSDPERELGADVGRLAFWQVSGIGMTAAKTLAVVEDDGTLLANGEAWDPRRLLAGPTTDNPATGVYTLEYPATAPNEDGTSTTVALIGATATVQEATALFASCVVEADARTITVRVWNAAGAATNGKILVQGF